MWLVGNNFNYNYFYSIKAVNVSTTSAILFVRRAKFTVVQDVYYENCTAAFQYLLSVTQWDNITVSNATFVNVRGANTDVYSIIFLETYTGTNIDVNGIYMYDSQLDQHKGIHASNYLAGYEPYLTLVNCIFKNITMKSGSTLISTIVVKKLVLQNITISQITQEDPKETSNIIIKVRGMNLNTTSSFEISNINMSNSSVSLLDLSNIYNSQITGKSVKISDISYTNSIIQYKDDLIIIEGIETYNDFTITIDNIVISNITFVRGGNIIVFEQQTAQTLVVTNSYFENNIGSSIHFEAYNKNNPTLKTNMKFVNMTIINSSGDSQSSLVVSTGSLISIYNSSFINNNNLLSGSVASVDSLNTILQFINSTFQNNTSIKGGVFNVEDQGTLILINWTLQNNFALQSGVIQGSNDGYFEIYSSTISENYAYSIPISELFLVSPLSIISNWQIMNNNALTQSIILQEIKKWNLLWFLSQSYKAYLSSNTNQISSLANKNWFQLISSSLSIESSTVIQNQSYVVDSFQSNFTSKDIIIKNWQTSANIFSISSTNLIANNLTILNISSLADHSSVISGQFQSVISMSNIKYTNSSTVFVRSDSTQLNMDGIETSSISLNENLISFTGCTNISLKGFNIYSINLTASIIYSSTSSFDIIQNVVISNIKSVGFEFYFSNVTQIIDLSFINLSKGMTITNSQINSISNSMFSGCGDSSIIYGGAIDIVESSSTIYNWSFSNNLAQSGGAISVRWSQNTTWNSKITQNQFSNNRAIYKGGAINYENKRPEISNNMNCNNSASYGSNIASYPVKIVENGTLKTSTYLSDVSSGVALEKNLVFAIQDFENQTIPDDSYSIKILPITQNSSISGYDSAKANHGLATFKNLIFIKEPGAQHVQFEATSTSIDMVKNQALNVPFINIIDVSFRFWKPGESQISSSECQEWAPGTYSFHWNSSICESWMNNAVWAGKTEIQVNPGYWRKSTNSTSIFYCNYPAAWLGGFHPENEHPVEWAEGYTGYLCSEWDFVNGEKYQKVNENQWTKWSNPAINAIKFIGVILAAFLFLMILIVLTIRKKQENQTSILARIFTNYIQLISAAMTFNVKFPVTLTQIFGSVQIIGSTSDTFLSYDWLFPSLLVTGIAPSADLFKIILTGFVPLFLILICSLIWVFMHFFINKWCLDLKRNIVVSVIWIIFLLHPTITKSSLLIFECTNVDKNDKRMSLYIKYVWYSSQHLFWIVWVSIPNFLVWIAGAPLLALYILFKYRKRLEDEKIKTYMLVLYQGLKPRTFYWEFVNTIRKVLILMCSVFLSTENSLYRILISIIILLAIIRVQLKLKPYKLEENNEIEQKAIYAGIITLFWGLIFSQEEYSVALFNTFAFLLLISVNAIFFIIWMFYFLISLNIKNEKFKMFMHWYAFILMRKYSLERFELLNSKSALLFYFYI